MRGKTFVSLDVCDDQTSSGPVNWDSLGIIGAFSKDMKELYVPWDSTTPSENFKVLELQDFFMKLSYELERKCVLLTWMFTFLLFCVGFMYLIVALCFCKPIEKVSHSVHVASLL